MAPAADHLALQRAVHEHARAVLGDVLAACGRAAVDVLPVKGIVTAYTLYPDPGLRPILDVDLRVRPGDLGRTARMAEQAGWRLLGRSIAYRTLSFDVRGFLVEFEAHVGPPGLCDLTVDAMMARAMLCAGPFGTPYRQPEIHDHALLLCVNAFKDKLIEARPAAVLDLEIIAEAPGFSDERFVDLARASSAATLVWLVACWLADSRGSARWAALRDRVGPHAPRASYAVLFQRAIRTRSPSRALLRVLARAGSDRPAARIRAMGAMALKPFDGVTGSALRALGVRPFACLLVFAASILSAPGSVRADGNDDAGAPRALMTCERADGPGRVRCEVEVIALPGGSITWGDVELTHMPPFTSALRGRIGPGDATVRRPDSWRWGLALVARTKGTGDVEARVRLVECRGAPGESPDAGATHDSCVPYEVPVTGHIVVGD